METEVTETRSQRTEMRWFCTSCGINSGIHHYLPQGGGCVNCGKRLTVMAVCELRMIEAGEPTTETNLKREPNEMSQRQHQQQHQQQQPRQRTLVGGGNRGGGSVEQITGVIGRILFRKSDAEFEGAPTFFIASLEVESRNPEDRISVKGYCEGNELREGRNYVFTGHWDKAPSKYPGRTFNFQFLTPHEPNSQRGTMLYLEDMCKGIGPVIACQLFDACQAMGLNAVATLRSDPEKACELVPRLNPEIAKAASRTLKNDAAMQDTKIELREIFDGTGFPKNLTEQVVKKWGPYAPRKIRKDPFTLMVHGFSGCGFARCDRLHSDFGLPQDSMKRIVMCVYHSLSRDRDGHTWFPLAKVRELAQQQVGGVDISGKYKASTDSKFARALKIAVKAKWMAVRKEDGQWWVADAAKANSEREIAEHLDRLTLAGGEFAGDYDGLHATTNVRPRFTEALPDECDDTSVCGKCNDEGIVWTQPKGNMINGWINCPDCRSSEKINETMREEQRLGIVDCESRERVTSEMIRLGKQLGICQFCGRRLINGESVRHGYGPVCARKHGLPWDDSHSGDDLSSTPEEIALIKGFAQPAQPGMESVEEAPF